MMYGRIMVCLLIISYLVNLGHNFIPHHHHHEDHKNSTHFDHHHSPVKGQDKENHNHHSSDFLFCIFSNILHHNDNGLIVVSTSDNEYKSDSSGNAFGLLSEANVFENFTPKDKKKQPPENYNYFKLQQTYAHGLRAPPTA